MEKKVYRAIVRVMYHGARGNKRVETEHKDVVIVGTEDQARVQYEYLKQRYNMYSYLANYSGAVELYEPKVFDDGTLSHYPTDEETYIERESF